MKFGLPKLAFRKNISTLLIAVGIMHLADYIIIPIFPVLMSIEKGLSAAKIGALIGIGSLSFQIGSIFGGIISDKIGRKITLVIGGIVNIIALIGFALSNVFSTFIFFQVLNGTGGGIFAPTCKAAIAEDAQESTNTRTTAFSLRGMAANLGIAIGGLIPLLVPNLKFEAFFFTSAAFYVGLIILALFIPNSKKEKEQDTSIKRYAAIFKNKPFILFSILTILIWAIYAQLSILLPLRAATSFKNVKLVGSIWTLTSLFVVVFQTPIALHIIEKISLFSSLVYGTIIMGIGIFLIGFSSSYLFLLFSALIFIMGEMFVIPTIDSLTSELANQKIIGGYFSFANLVYGLGFAFGSFSGGQLINLYGINHFIPWVVILIASFIIAGIIYIVHKRPIIKEALKD